MSSPSPADSTATTSFESVYDKHRALVRRVLTERGVRNGDLDDVVQETFVIVHRLLPEFEGRSSIETWLYAIAMRVAANHRRKRRSDSEPVETADDDSGEPEVIPERVYASLSHVDDEQRDLLALHEIGGMSISTLAEITGNARATIRQRLERGQAMFTRSIDGRARGERDWLKEVAALFENPPDTLAPGVLRVASQRQNCIAALDDTIFIVWRRSADDEATHAACEALIAHAHARPEGIRYFSIIERGSTPPTRQGRAMMTLCARKLGRQFKAVGNVVEGSRLMKLVPAVMNTCIFLAREPVNMRFFYELEDMMAWLGQYGALDVTAALALLVRMRASLD